MDELEQRILDLCEEFTKTGLAKRCQQKGLPSTGTKEEMARALVESKEISSANDSTMDQFHDADEKSEAAASSAAAKVEPSIVQQPYSFRDVEEGIEAFCADGSVDFAAWLTDFEEVATMAGWSDEQKYVMCRKKLVGTARSFLLTMRGVSSFRALRKALVAEFGEKVRPMDIHRQLASRRRKKVESALDFIYSMQRIAKQIDLDEESVCEYIVDGIAESEAQRSALYEARTVRELKEKIAWQERAAQKQTRAVRSAWHERAGQKENKSLPVQDTIPVKNATKARCLNCGVMGHMVRNCPEQRSGPRCFQCNEFGHRANQCGQRNKQQPGTSANLINHVQAELPTKMVQLGGKNIKAVIDTGSEVSIVRQDTFQDLGCVQQRIEQSIQQLRGFGGIIQKPIGELVTNIGIDEVEYEISLLVVSPNSMKVPMLVSMNFLRSVCYAITNAGVQISKKKK
ncbi:uncharacterized protein LOC121602736 [Anopheles merus]|uniref:uncharacterized protein LOC121602736 n=1 Tax=Anopheles merus TaxID=30066 RepID=UPI001BE457C3|nr:uncharacterized protein LOC121602736 [Anopheles merus]